MTRIIITASILLFLSMHANATLITDQQYLGPQIGEAKIGIIPELHLGSRQPERIYKVGQSFTVGVSGFLSSINVLIGTRNTPEHALNMGLYSLIDGTPNLAKNLGEISVSAESILSNRVDPFEIDYVQFDLSALGISVEVDQELSFVLSSEQDFHTTDNAYNGSFGIYSGGYSGGSGFLAHGSDGTNFSEWEINGIASDMIFTTYVDVNACSGFPDHDQCDDLDDDVVKVTEPSTFGLLGVALIGVGFARRRIAQG